MNANLIGRQIDQYRIDALLGSGGMGTVYQAYDLNLARKVALKVMNPQLAGQTAFRERFLQEAQAAARLDHPSIVSIYQFGASTDYLFIVMAFISGSSLNQYVRHKQSLSSSINLGEILRLMAQVADALDYAHGQGVVHRDIKPDNLLLKPLTQPDRLGDPLLRAVITDFGLAKLLDGGISTQTGTFMGTLPYMSPEQCLGKPLDGRSDLYAMGILLYQLVTGQLPFVIQSPTDAVHKHLYETPPPPGKIHPGLPEPLENIILKGIAKEPDGRFQTGAELASTLRLTAESLNQSGLTILQTLPPAVTELQQDQPGPPPGVSSFNPNSQSTAHGDVLMILNKDETTRSVTLTGDTFTIGRGSENDLALQLPGISRHHCRLERTEAGWQIVDLNSTNGTFLEESPLLPNVPQSWQPGSRLRIGSNYFVWKIGKSQAADMVSSAAASGTISQSLSAQIDLVMTPAQVTLAAGDTAGLQLTLHNQGILVDHYEVDVSGIPQEWVNLSETKIQLMPGGKALIRLVLNPPRSPAVMAGDHPFTVRATAVSSPNQFSEIKGNLTLTPFTDYQVDMRPQRLKSGGSVRVLIKNLGNDGAEFHVNGRDPGDSILFTAESKKLMLAPGEKATIDFTLTAQKRAWMGAPSTTPFSLHIRPQQGESQSLTGQLDIPPRLPRWLVPALSVIFLVLCAVGFFALNVYTNFIQTPTPTVAAISEATAVPEPSALPSATANPNQTPVPVPATQTPVPSPTSPPTAAPTTSPTPIDLNAGLLAYFSFDEPDSFYLDYSGNGNDGLKHREARCLFPFTDRFGFAEKAAVFAGYQVSCTASPPEDYGLARMPHLNFTNNFTWALWVQQAANGNNAWLIGQMEWANINMNIIEREKLTFEIPGSNGVRVTEPDPLPRDDWAFYVITVSFDGEQTTINLYRDAVLVQTAVVTGVAYSNPGEGEFHIGATLSRTRDGEINVNGGRESFKGGLDDIRVYNRPLSLPEILALYQQGGWPDV